MLTPLLIIAIIGYILATYLIIQFIRNSDQVDKTPSLTSSFFILAVIATSAHSVAALQYSEILNSLNFSVSSMVLFISAILTVIFLLGCLIMPIRRLGILVFPLSALSIVFSLLWLNTPHYLVGNLSSHVAGINSNAMTAHIVVSILAYCLISIASIQALIYAFQERQIKQRKEPSLLLALPPLQTMEALLFKLVWLGFILLSLTLISGIVFCQEIFGVPFEFKHHTVLSILGWATFAYLLFQHSKNGIRGKKAVILTLLGFILIQLGYFGTKIVLESF